MCWPVSSRFPWYSSYSKNSFPSPCLSSRHIRIILIRLERYRHVIRQRCELMQVGIILKASKIAALGYIVYASFHLKNKR